MLWAYADWWEEVVKVRQVVVDACSILNWREKCNLGEADIEKARVNNWP